MRLLQLSYLNSFPDILLDMKLHINLTFVTIFQIYLQSFNLFYHIFTLFS
jgi:hypothetical protein